jgi:hypothetical protein
MKTFKKQLTNLGFSFNEQTGEYNKGNKIVSVKKNENKEFLVCFSYQDFEKSCYIMHYCNKVGGFQPAMTRHKSLLLPDLIQYFY